MDEKQKEEVLEALWISKEKGNPITCDMTQVAHEHINSEILSILEEDDLISIISNEIHLTEIGEARGRLIIRRHRLAERLMFDVLGMSLDTIEKNACELEHILAPDLTESICTLLGHPKICPHGHPIPKGQCCQETRNSVENVLMPLDKAEAGKCVKIAYVSSPKHPVLHKLISFGLLPGTTITVHQKSPSFVIQLDNAQLAI
ncbi:metal-dependent transcriptional regulator, partial [candidate division KSB1 bacterium]